MKLLLRRAAQWVHKWLALLVGIQIFAWVLGGAIFAVIPFDGWVKSGDVVRKAPKPTAETPLFPLAEVATRYAPLRSIELIGQGQYFYYRLTDSSGNKSLVNARDGSVLPKPNEETIRQLARDMYLGDAPLQSVRRVDQPEPRKMLLVDELGGKIDVWQANFADSLNTRLYFSAQSGEFIRARSDAWVLYDFFWRLHIMDYGDGENFNNKFLRVLSPLALVLVLSGVTLLFFSQFRKRRMRVGK
jgi:uncharacterized iron-regulated membrane protein